MFVQDADGNYLADVVIHPIIDYTELAHKPREPVDVVPKANGRCSSNGRPVASPSRRPTRSSAWKAEADSHRADLGVC